MQVRQEALKAYREIQNGLRARAEVKDTFYRHKLAMQKTYDALKEEYEDLKKIIFTMTYQLKEESYYEASAHFLLLRDRQSHCAMGMIESCNFFYSGPFIICIDWAYVDIFS